MKLYHESVVAPTTKEQISRYVNKHQFAYSPHAYRRTQEKRIRDWQYIAKHGRLIELGYDNGRIFKVLLRTPDGHCAVFGLLTKEIITTWYNDPNDNHATLDASRYFGGVRN